MRKSLIVFLFVVINASFAVAESSWEVIQGKGSVIYKIIDKQLKNVSISKGSTNPTGNLEIPSKITKNGISYNVTDIEFSAFSYCDSLTSVKIPNTIESIGNSAFLYCSSLANIQIGDSVETIGDYAFYYCLNVKNIEIPNAVETIGDYAFAYCSRLKDVKMGLSIEYIGDWAFNSCTKLREITMLKNMPPKLGKNIFDNKSYSSKLVSLFYDNYDDGSGLWQGFEIVEDN